MNLPTTQHKLSQARTDLVLDHHAFFAMPVLKLPMIEDRSFDRLATNGIDLRYNPDFVDKLPGDQLVTGFGHEGLHNMLLHPFRFLEMMQELGDDFDQDTANEAADHIVNLILEDAGFTPIDGWLCDRAFEGMSLRQVYDILMSRKRKGDKGDDSGKGNQPGSSGNQQPGQQQQPGSQPGTQPGQPGSQPGNGPAKPWNIGEVLPYPGEKDDGTPPSPAEIAQAKQQWKATMAQAATIARGAGKLPLGAERIIQEIMNPKVPWYELLRNYFDQFSRDDYTWTRPNPRYVHTGFYMPSLRDETVGEIVMAVDMSGSVSQDAADEFATEVSGILESFDQITIHVVYFDTSVHSPEEFTSDDLPITLNPKGGGGTSFKPAMGWVEENDLDPMCMIYLTDLQSYSFPEEPAFPVLWVLTPRDHRTAQEYGFDQVPFGDVIVMEE